MTIKFYLKRPDSKVETVIYAAISLNGYRMKYYTLEKIIPKYWNGKAQLAKSSEDFKSGPEFNETLKSLKRSIESIYYNYKNTHKGEPPSKDQFATLLDKEFKKNVGLHTKEKGLATFWGYFEDFLERCESGSRLHLKNDTPLANNTIKNFKNLKTHLQEFEKWNKTKLDFEFFDLVFHKSFTNYLTKEKKQQPATMGKLITNLKVVLHEALEDGKNKFNVFQFRKFKSYTSDSHAIYLREDELKEIVNLDLQAEKKLERVKDLFLVGVLTGLRHSDINKLSGENLDGGVIKIKQTKTGKVVEIPARQIVIDIFNKYGGKLPRYSNQKFNEYIKKVCEKCPLLSKPVMVTIIKGGKKETERVAKSSLVSSHTMRRSFATNEYLAGILSVAEIKEITSHASDKSFFRYIRMTPKENIDNIRAKYAERDKKSGVLFGTFKVA